MQLELYLDGNWKPVVRYDNAHGFAHRDVLNPKGDLIEKRTLKLGSLDEVLEFAEQDLSDRFEWYVEKFLKIEKGALMADTKEHLQKDITEAFEFARFVLKHPKTLTAIKNGSEIQFVPAASSGMRRPSRASKKIQAFSTETVFHRL